MFRLRTPTLVVLTSGFLVALAATFFPSRAVTREEPARVVPPATVVEGAPAERGRAYGKQFRTAIRAFLDEEVYAPFVGKPATKEQMLRYATACGQVVRAECPLVAEEFQGIAEGSGLAFAEVMLINLHEELYHRTDLPKQGHCTAVAVAPPDTGDRHTYVGQTWDWMRTVAGKSRVLEWRRGDGASVLAYGFPGMPMGAGVNSEGIALCWTSAALGTKGQAARVGLPSYVLIAHLLAQKDMDAVVREARKDRHAGWFTFVMADGNGRLVNIEGSPTGVVVEEPKARLARVDFGSRAMTRARDGEPVRLHQRCQLMYSLLEGSRGQNGLARLQQYFAEPGHKINVGPSTIDMMVFDATARKAYLSRGTSYNLAWREFAFGAKP